MKRKKRPEFSSTIKRKIMERTGSKCERCKVDFDENFKGKFYHIIPVIFGGDNSESNCSLLCKNCHRIAPNIRNKDELLIYNNYFLRFASFKEAAQFYNVETRFDLSIKAALDVSKVYKNK